MAKCKSQAPRVEIAQPCHTKDWIFLAVCLALNGSFASCTLASIGRCLLGVQHTGPGTGHFNSPRKISWTRNSQCL